MQRLAKFKQILYMGLRAYQNFIIRKNFTVPFLKYKHSKLKLRVFLVGHSVAMVLYVVTYSVKEKYQRVHQ